MTGLLFPSRTSQSAEWHRVGILLLVMGLLVSLVGCASSHKERVVYQDTAAVHTSPPPTRVYFYPTAGQDAAQQDRDRYECHVWAVRQSGFDPSLPLPAQAPRVEVMPSPAPGHDTALGAVTGAVLGAAVGSPYRTGEGAVIGAVAGTMIGASSDATRQEQAAVMQERYSRREGQWADQLERRALDYRRAMGACLEGRGYAVR